MVFTPNRIALSVWGNSTAVRKGNESARKAMKRRTVCCDTCFRGGFTPATFGHHKRTTPGHEKAKGLT